VKVLVACEFSATVREAFTRRGHFAMSCDLLPTEIYGQHYIGKVEDLLDMNWDLMIAHPPCTYLSNSGVTWLTETNDPNLDRWYKMEEGADFFKLLLDSDISHKAIENPIMHKYAIDIIGRKQDQIIHPYEFGHPESKSTCLWLYNLPKLKATNNVYSQFISLPKRERERLHYLPPSVDRWKLRSTTFQGIADAMAEQWGNDV